MGNKKQIETSHDKVMIKENYTAGTETMECDCRQEKTCPLDWKILTSGITYQTIVTRDDTNTEETT